MSYGLSRLFRQKGVLTEPILRHLKAALVGRAAKCQRSIRQGKDQQQQYNENQRTEQHDRQPMIPGRAFARAMDLIDDGDLGELGVAGRRSYQ